MLQVVLERRRETVEGLDFVERAIGSAFGTRAVVADDVDDHRVVGVGQLVHGVDQASALVIGEGEVAGEVFKQAQVEFLLIGGEGVPGGHPFRARRELRIRRDDARLELPGIGFLADFFPALIELALELVAPFLGRVMRGVGRAGGEIQEERFLRGDGLGIFDVVDRPVGHVGHQVITFLRRGLRLDGAGVLEEHRIILVRLSADEAVEILEAHACRPAVKGPGHAAFPVGRVVILAEP